MPLCEVMRRKNYIQFHRRNKPSVLYVRIFCHWTIPNTPIQLRFKHRTTLRGIFLFATAFRLSLRPFQPPTQAHTYRIYIKNACK